VTRIVIIGGGPAGYESALVAAQLGATVTVVDSDGIGGSCVLTDCVPSKTLIATSDRVTAFRDAPRVGVGTVAGEVAVDLTSVHDRIKKLAQQQSADIAARLVHEIALPIDTTRGPMTVTASCGVLPIEAGLTAKQLLDAADAAMYRAKKQGRNRVSL